MQILVKKEILNSEEIEMFNIVTHTKNEMDRDVHSRLNEKPLTMEEVTARIAEFVIQNGAELKETKEGKKAYYKDKTLVYQESMTSLEIGLVRLEIKEARNAKA